MSTREKIVIIQYANPDGYPPTINGIKLLSDLYDVIVICRNLPVKKVTYPESVRFYRCGRLYLGGRNVFWRKLNNAFDFVCFILKAYWVTCFSKTKVVYAYDPFGFIAGFIAAKFLQKKKLIYHNHDYLPLTQARGGYWFLKKIELLFCKGTELFIFPDKDRCVLFKKETKESYPYFIVMNTPLRQENVPAKRLRDYLTEKFSLNKEAQIVLYQGNIGPGHGIEAIIQSVPLWIDRAVMVFLGRVTASRYEKFHTMIEAAGLDKRIFFLGEIACDSILSLTADADVGLNLYDSPNFNHCTLATSSNKTFEYMSVGLPFLLSKCPSTETFFPGKKYICLVNPRDAAAVASAVNYWLTHEEERLEAGRWAREDHLNIFNYEAQFEPVIRFINQCFKEGEED